MFGLGEEFYGHSLKNLDADEQLQNALLNAIHSERANSELESATMREKAIMHGVLSIAARIARHDYDDNN